MSLNWYYNDNGSKNGPHTAERMQELIEAGKVKHRTTVWRNGLKEWILAEDSELAEYFAPGTETPPPTPESVAMWNLLGRIFIWCLLFPLFWLIIWLCSGGYERLMKVFGN